MLTGTPRTSQPVNLAGQLVRTLDQRCQPTAFWAQALLQDLAGSRLGAVVPSWIRPYLAPWSSWPRLLQ